MDSILYIMFNLKKIFAIERVEIENKKEVR